ncbi:hypothetical protein [Campylobacter sp. CCS1377]|uniref:Uncharacterized protein n=1 Tax=Campylobacter sp. CCS1377 TaxID=3158229 RepID=A0AAU7E6H9_9BACT
MTAMLLNGANFMPSGVSGSGKITTLSNTETDYAPLASFLAEIKVKIDGEGWVLKNANAPKGNAKLEIVQVPNEKGNWGYIHIVPKKNFIKNFTLELRSVAKNDNSFVGDIKTYGPFNQMK